MNEYRVAFMCDDGFEGEEVILAANRIMALEIFESFGIPGVTSAEAYLVQ